MACTPQRTPYFRHYWTTSDLIERPYDWEEQENKFTAQMKKYESEKVLYNAFCEEKIAQIPVVKTQTTREAMQRIEQAKIDDFRAKCDNGNHHKRFHIPNTTPKKLLPNLNYIPCA
jgi:hypothetical protein